MTVAKRRALDGLRRDSLLDRKHADIWIESTEASGSEDELIATDGSVTQRDPGGDELGAKSLPKLAIQVLSYFE